MNNTIIKLLPATGYALLILCLLTGSEALLITAAVMMAVLIVISYSGRKEKGKENQK